MNISVPVMLHDLVRQTKTAADYSLFFYIYLSKKIRLGVSSGSSARQRIHKKYQVSFSLKSNEKVFTNVICCSRDWRFES